MCRQIKICIAFVIFAAVTYNKKAAGTAVAATGVIITTDTIKEPGIKWDINSMKRLAPHKGRIANYCGYPRMIQLQDKSLICVYEITGGAIESIKSFDKGNSRLDFLVDCVKNEKAVLGARMMGGGFGGCTINLIKEEAIEELSSRIEKAYRDAFDLEMKVYVSSIENGTEIIAANKNVNTAAV